MRKKARSKTSRPTERGFLKEKKESSVLTDIGVRLGVKQGHEALGGETTDRHPQKVLKRY